MENKYGTPLTKELVIQLSKNNIANRINAL